MSVFIVSIFVLSVQCYSGSPPIPISAPPAELKLDAFYTKYLDCGGIPVISSERVDDRAFYRLQDLLDHILAGRPDLKKTLAQEGFRCIIIAQEEQVTDIPEYADMKPKGYWNQRARGFGGPTTSCGEENLLNLPSDRYKGESIFIHELAHSIHRPGLTTCEPDFQKKLNTLYQAAMEKGLYDNDYAATDASEYWAESVQAFFDCDRENDKVHNHVNTREELTAYDPNMASLIHEVFRITEDTDWRYELYSEKLTIEETPKLSNQKELLPKYIWCYGFLVYGTENVPDESMLAASKMVLEIFKERYDILKIMADAGISVIVCQQEEEIPASDQSQIIVHLPAAEQFEIDQSKLVNDLIETAYTFTRSNPIKPDQEPVTSTKLRENLVRLDEHFDEKANSLYEAAMEKGLWQSSPAAKNRYDYVAHGAVPFFNAGTVTLTGNQTISNRKQLMEYDPDLANLLTDVFLPSQK